jgi:hypothetical protein
MGKTEWKCRSCEHWPDSSLSPHPRLPPCHRHRGSTTIDVQVPRSPKDHRQQKLGLHTTQARRVRQTEARGQGVDRWSVRPVLEEQGQGRAEHQAIPRCLRNCQRGMSICRRVRRLDLEHRTRRSGVHVFKLDQDVVIELSGQHGNNARKVFDEMPTISSMRLFPCHFF